jgi:tRNA A-37 threonylcarbamoyl transferase component Bud32
VLCPACAARALPGAVVCPNDGTILVPAATDPLVGQLVGTWRVVKRVGVGGMGAVYEALEENIAKRAALKVVHPHLSRDPNLPTLLAEARAVNAIGDQGIVDVYGFGTLPDGRSWLVMELLEGELLEDRLLREKRLPVLATIDILVPLLQALEAAHAAGFVHRDLKPANVFIVQRANRAPFPKLLDFGIASRIVTGSPDALGTAGYVSPEQAANVNVGAKADLYAVGCMMYELLTGELPFVAGDWNEVLRLHREAPRPSVRALRPEVPVVLDELIKTLMAVEPLRRPPSAASVRATLLGARERLVSTKARLTRTVTVGVLAALAVGVVAFLALRPTQIVVPPAPVPVVDDPVTVAAKKKAAEVEQQLAGPPAQAVDALLAAQQAFPDRPEWAALKGQLSASLRLGAQTALKRDEADAAVPLVGLLDKLGALSKDDPLQAEVKRASYARHNGMVRVGEVFIDRYEYPNRAGSLPTTSVDFTEAESLCEGAGKRLCTELEWEAACKGATGGAYPWGPRLERDRCVIKGPKAKGPAAAGSHARCVGENGVFDLVGNVAEWTSSPVREGEPQRVIRGGSYAQSDTRLACDARDYVLPGLGGAKHLGLRCCL